MADRVRQRNARAFTMVYNDFFRMPQSVVSYYDKLVFIAIKSHAGLSGSSFPSINLLHRETGISRQKIQDSISHLEDLGFLQKEKRQSDKHNGNISNLYTIYETEEMCRAGTPEAVKKAAETSEEDKAIETLARLGYTVIPPEQEQEKEPSVGGTTEGSGGDENNSIPAINYNSSHEKLQEKYSMDTIKVMMDYDVMVSSAPDRREYIDAAIHVIYNSVNTSKPTLRVGKEDRPSSVVISQLLKLNHITIMDCIDSILSASENEPVRNIQGYLLTTLYNAVTQPLQVASQVNYDMAHWKKKDKNQPREDISLYDNC